jgi:pilus assembly protein TadC
MSAVALGLGGAWGLVVLLALGRIVDRLARRARARELRGRDTTHVIHDAPGAVRRRAASIPALARLVGIGDAAAERRRWRTNERQVARALPVLLDLLAVGTSAGLTPYLAVEHAARWSVPTAGAPLESALRLARLGVPFADALDDVGSNMPPLRAALAVLAASVRIGAPSAEPLMRLGAEGRAALRRRAEERARSLSVRLLFPLVFLVLPAFALLVVVPTVISGFGGLTS